MNALNRFLNVLAGSVTGVFIGHSIYVCWEYQTYPGLYAMQSAPWYTSILTYGFLTGGTLLTVLILKLAVKVITKHKKQNAQDG